MTTYSPPPITPIRHNGGPGIDQAHDTIPSITFRLLGVAFLVQAAASALAGLVLSPVDLLASLAPGDVSGMMADLAANEFRVRAGILSEMVAATAIVALACYLYAVVRGHGRNAARFALGLYLVEVALLGFREVLVHALWWTSDQAQGTGAATETLTNQASTLFEAQSFAYSLHTLFFALGATIFYILLSRTGALPRWLMALGLLAAPLALGGEVAGLMGADVPLYVFLPNLPFELGAGLWLALKGSARAAAGN